MAVAGGFATTTATGVLATGSLLVAFATPQAQAAVDYSVYADYAFTIYQWTGPTSGGNKGFVSRGYWYEMEYSDGALNYKLANGEKIPSGTYNETTNFESYILSDKTIVFDANSNCFANAQYSTYAANTCYIYDCDGAAFSALVVKADAAGVVLLASKSEVNSRDVILGATDTENTSYSIFEKDFTIDTRASDITLRGNQQWQIAEGATFKLGAFGDNTKAVNQSGVLTIAGNGTALMNNKLVVAENALINVNSGATLTLAALNTTSTATITNNGTLNINGNITLGGSLYEYAEKQAATKTYSLDNENGYLSVEGDAQYWIVQGTGVVTLATGVTITDADGNTHTAMQDGNKGLYISMSVDEDTLDYYITTDTVAVDMSATGAGESGAAETYVLNGGTMKLSGGTLAGDKVRSLKDSTIDIAATGVLTNLTNISNTVTLTGSGTYDLGNSTTINVAGLTDSGWEGTVAIGGGTTAFAVTDFSFNKYGHAASAVEVSGVSGWLTPSTTYLPEVVFTQNDTLGYAMLVNNGSSGSHQTFSGAVSGNGTLKIDFSGGTLTNMHFNFTGDVSEWMSADGSTTPELYIATPNKTTHVDFSGDATEINADTYAHQGTLNLTVTNDKAVTINGTLTHQGGTQSVFNVTVVNSADTSIYNTVNISNLTNNGTGAIVVGSKVVDGVEMTGALTVTGSGSLGALTLAGGTAEVAGTSSISTLSVLAESATPALTAKGALTLSSVEVDCSGWTGITLDKVYTLATVVDGGSLNWADTSRQSVSGIDDALALDGIVSLNDAGELVLSFSKKMLSDTTAYWDAAAGKTWSESAWKESDAADAGHGYIGEDVSAVFAGAGSTPAEVVVDTNAVVTDLTVSDGSYTFSKDATNGGSLTVTDTLSIGADGSATLDMEATVKNIELTDSSATLTVNKALTISDGGKLTATAGGTIVNGLANAQPLVMEGASLGGVATKEGDVVHGNGLKLVGSNFTLTNVTLTGQIDNSAADSIQLVGTIILDTVAMGDLVEGKATTYYDQVGSTQMPNDNGYTKESLVAKLFTASNVMQDPLYGVTWMMKDSSGAMTESIVTINDNIYYISSAEASTEFVAADADVAAEYDANEALFSERATALVLNGGSIILQTGLDKSEGSKLTGGIRAMQGGSVTITDSVTLDAADLHANGNTVTLLGGGTYDLGASTEMNSGVEVGAADGWQGTVMTAATDITDLSAMGNAASTVDLTGDVVTTALSTGNVGTVKVKSLEANTLSTTDSALTVAGATKLTQGGSVGQAAFEGGLELGTADAAAILNGGELSLSKLTLANLNSKVQAASLSNSTLDINISKEQLAKLSIGDTRTLVSLSNDSSLAALSFNGDADGTIKEYAAKYFHTISWKTPDEVMLAAARATNAAPAAPAVVVLSSVKNPNYVTEKVEPTSENGKAGAQLLNDLFIEVDPQTIEDPTKAQAAMAALLDAVDAGNMTDETAAALAGSSISTLGLALSGDVERQLRAIRNRTTTMGVNECVVNEGMPYFNAWFNAEGNRAKLDADSTNPGYTLDSWGGTVGFDVDVNPNFTMGLAISAMYGNITTDSPDNLDGDMDTYYLSLFARYADYAWTHTFVATLGKMDGSYSRTIPDWGTTDANIDGTSFGLLYEVGYVLPLDEDGEACIQPIFNVMLRHSSVGSFTENGDLGLDVDQQSMTTLTFGLGTRIQAVVGETVYNRASIFEGRILAKADLGDHQSEADVAFVNGASTKATVKSAEIGAIGLEIGAGLTIPLGDDDGSLFIDGSVELRSGYTDVNGTVGYRINF